MGSIKHLFPASLKDRVKAVLKRAVYGSEAVLPSTSTCGEDRILSYLLRRRQAGFFVDVGAYHPIAFSNTYVFYQQGWRGLNIDPCPGSMRAFDKERPGDINLEVAIGDAEGEMMYHTIGDGHHQMNSFNPEFQENLYDEVSVDATTVRKSPVRLHRLSSVLAAHLKPGQSIDFITIDVEGLEESVLRSNDWTIYRPVIVMVENHRPLVNGVFTSPLLPLMEGFRYSLVFKTPNEIIFLNNEYALNKSGMVVL